MENIKEFCKRIRLPEERILELERVQRIVYSDKSVCEEFENDIYLLFNFKNQEELRSMLDSIIRISGKISVSEKTVYMLFYVCAAPILLELYKKNGISEEIYWDSLGEMLPKSDECMSNYGIQGIASYSWYIPFFRMERFKLGRFEYEVAKFDGVYEKYTYHHAGYELKPGDDIIHLHIPSGEDMSEAKRIDSYKKAFDFFGKKIKGGAPVFFHAKAWLFFPEHYIFLPKKSNIIGLMNDFVLIDYGIREDNKDLWRVFGVRDDYSNADLLPQKTSLQRAYAGRIRSGGKFGWGEGVMLFDGEKIIK